MKMDFRKRREKTAPWPSHLFSSQSHLKNVLIIARQFSLAGQLMQAGERHSSRICLCTLNEELFQWGLCPVQPLWSRVQVSGFVNTALCGVQVSGCSCTGAVCFYERVGEVPIIPTQMCSSNPHHHPSDPHQHPSQEPHSWAPVPHVTCGTATRMLQALLTCH